MEGLRRRVGSPGEESDAAPTEVPTEVPEEVLTDAQLKLFCYRVFFFMVAIFSCGVSGFFFTAPDSLFCGIMFIVGLLFPFFLHLKRVAISRIKTKGYWWSVLGLPLLQSSLSVFAFVASIFFGDRTNDWKFLTPIVISLISSEIIVTILDGVVEMVLSSMLKNWVKQNIKNLLIGVFIDFVVHFVRRTLVQIFLQMEELDKEVEIETIEKEKFELEQRKDKLAKEEQKLLAERESLQKEMAEFEEDLREFEYQRKLLIHEKQNLNEQWSLLKLQVKELNEQRNLLTLNVGAE